ncbi:hypothetical protein ACFRAQ_25885 [Nocardia sp. NPDC056611]|uniref:hypothetical protein n=1 Tax=Nocardia sp. NPDC056611 TaxID=3345877 RepID=UPI0036708C95
MVLSSLAGSLARVSMHEIEDLVEWSVRVLDARHPGADRRVRDWFGELYSFQGGYDCSFTQFRVMEILLARDYCFRFGIDAHPDYPGRREFFDGLEEFTALADIAVDDDEDGSRLDAWLEEGYVDPPHLYCDAGTALWRRAVEVGLIAGTGAEPLRRVALADVVREVVLAAEAEGEIGVIATWHALGPTTLLPDFHTEEPWEMPALREIRAIALRTGATTFELPSGLRTPPEYCEEDELEAWWMGAAEDGPR